jgi:hypothetical protein
MAPLRPFVDEDFADTAPRDRDPLLFVEVISQAVERPASEGQAQAPRVGRRGGEDLGALLGRVGRRAPGPGLILQPAEPPVVEAMDPGVDGGLADTQVAGDLAGSAPVGDGQEHPGALDESGLGGARGCELFERPPFIGGGFAERDSGEGQGCTSSHSRATPFLCQTNAVSSLAGCTT